jgi:NADPH2:quinone reductase
MRQLGQWFTEGRVTPHISARFPLDRAREALRLMAERKVTGKVVLTA